MTGRKRSAKNFPSHIDRDKLPKGIYWDSSGSGHWYISFFDTEGNQKRKRVAGKKANMSNLHRIIEANTGVVHDTYDYICEMYFKSEKYIRLKTTTKKTYATYFNQVSKFVTKQNTFLGKEPLSNWSRTQAQRLVDNFEKNRGPTSANHMIRFSRRAFNWAISRGYANTNPFQGIELAEERKKRTLPTKSAYEKVLEFSKTPQYPYLWIMMELAYLCRMRGIEILDLTDENELDEGLFIRRRKGSRDNIIKWNKRLRKAWDAAKKLRKSIFEDRKLVMSMNENERFILVSSKGEPLKRSSLSTAWQRTITDAIKDGIIEASERFSPHDLKRMGITDTKGTRAQKMQASGHRTEAMMDVYDLEIAVVDAVADE